MMDELFARYRAHRQEIGRCRSLLATGLTELEQRLIEQRIAEEEAAVSALAFRASPPLAQSPFFNPHAQVARDCSRDAVLIGALLPFQVQANIDDHTLAVTTETAKEAFAKAVEWQILKFVDVSISDGTRRYTVTEFASFMAVNEVANTVCATTELKRNAKPES